MHLIAGRTFDPSTLYVISVIILCILQCFYCENAFVQTTRWRVAMPIKLTRFIRTWKFLARLAHHLCHIDNAVKTVATITGLLVDVCCLSDNIPSNLE